jgi:hypothetical protein
MASAPENRLRTAQEPLGQASSSLERDLVQLCLIDQAA